MATLDAGIVLLPDLRWADVQRAWPEAEQRGFGTAWTYDHLSWRSLRDGPWYAAIPLLTAAAGLTSRLRLGTLVASPNFRHPVTLAKDAMTLDEVSGGRVDLGVGAGAGAPSADATVLGQQPWSAAERAERFAEFVGLLDTLLREPATTYAGRFYAAHDARMVPGCVQRPRLPLTVAAAGPKALAVAARHGDAWVSYGPAGGAEERKQWYGGLADQGQELNRACETVGRDPASIRRLALVGLTLAWPVATDAAFDDFCARLVDLGFTGLVLHAPRPWDPDLPGPTPEMFDRLCGRLRSGRFTG